ncbi:MAG: hypothetical protein RSF34_12530, partial [Flavobacterium sp.]|uniref:hypothetical protein n=1 Tax=Flavobacterium sp. TaxID=239 RepID=UPI002FCB1C42
LFFGLSNFLPFLYYFFKIRKEYKKLGDAKIKEIERLKDYKGSCFELNENSLIITTQENSKIINWQEFKIWLIKEENLILITKEFETYILGREEVGGVNFENIISFINEKIVV